MPDARFATLEHRVALLEDALGLTYSVPIEWGLTLTEARLFGLIRKVPVVRLERLRLALYADQADFPQDATMYAHICNIRRKLKPHGIRINTANGVGYWLDQETRARLAA